MAADGQSFIDIPTGCKVYIKQHENPIKIARFKNKTYFDILHTRLNWGVSLKLKNA
jgi:NAD kinase